MQWQGTQRAHSGSSSQGTKRRADSDSIDLPYDSKRVRGGTASTSKASQQADANGHNSPAKLEADDGHAAGSDLHDASSGT